MRGTALFAGIALAAAASSRSQDVPYVATPPEVVERMLQLAQVKAGDAKAAARVPALGPVAGISSMLAVIFAVFAFH